MSNLKRTPVAYDHYTQTLDMFRSTMSWNETRRKSMYGTYCQNIKQGKYDREVFWVEKDRGSGQVVEVVKIPTRFLMEEAARMEDSEDLDQRLAEVRETTVEDLKGYPTDEDIANKFLQLKKSADERGLEFDLNLTCVRNMLKAKKCFYTGIPLVRGDDPKAINYPTVDRKNPNKGYVIGNVCMASNMANQFKSTIEHEIGDIITKEQKAQMLKKMFL